MGSFWGPIGGLVVSAVLFATGFRKIPILIIALSLAALFGFIK